MAAYFRPTTAVRHASFGPTSFGREWAPSLEETIEPGRSSRRHRWPAGDLEARVARRTAGRLARVARALPQARPALLALSSTLASLPPEARRRHLRGPDLRGFLGEAEIWIAALRLAAAPGRHAEAARARRLFDLVSRTEHLVTLVPGGRLERGFAAGVARFARARLRHALYDLGAFVLGLRLAFPSPRALVIDLECREEPEQGRPRDRVDLGAVLAPAGPLALAGDRLAAGTCLRARLAGRTLVLRPRATPRGVGPPRPGWTTVIPAAGSRLRHRAAAGRGEGGSAASARAGAGPVLVQRSTIPGTPILLAPALVSRPRNLWVGRDVPELGERLARALRLVRLAWPAGHDEILRRTFMVVPVREEGLVSYSLAARPGISFINVFGKTLVDLADDLLHETAHHRLHDIQETAGLLAPGPAAHEVQAFDSPWRGTRRPLHGILHGAYTFLYRAELLRRLLRLARARPRRLPLRLGRRGPRWLRRELDHERAMLARALRQLDGAAREGLLTPAGRALLRAMRLGI